MQPTTRSQVSSRFSNTQAPKSSYISETKPSAQNVFNTIVRYIPQAEKFTELVYTNISSDDGPLICHSLASTDEVERRTVRINFNSQTHTLRIKIMPTELHDAHQRWITEAIGHWLLDGLLTREEMMILATGVGTTFSGFDGKFKGSSKEPDFFLRADTSEFPSIVVETGWAESVPHLRADKDIWLKGSKYTEIVLLLKWMEILGGRVKGNIEVWSRTENGDSIVRNLIIFPQPTSLSDDRIEFTKGQLFGRFVSEQNRDVILSLRMARLRAIAEEVLVKKMSLVPARE